MICEKIEKIYLKNKFVLICFYKI